MEHLIFHVDVNSAFLSWEAVYRLKHLGGREDLRTIVSAVGGDMSKRHGIILAKSIPSKAYHIHTGESITEALNKCPSLKIVPPHYSLYSKCSQALMELLREYTPDLEQYSIDEAFLDLSQTCHLFGSPIDTANEIRHRIWNELGFSVNIGISTNKLLAKMASDFEKPNRTHTLWPDEIPQKMWPLPVSELFFVGRATFQKLHILGIRTIGDLAHTELSILRRHLKSQGDVIWNYANGRDFALVENTIPANKGYGNSVTIAFDVVTSSMAHRILLSLAETIGMRLRRDHVQIQVLSVGIKFFDFSHISHQKILTESTDITLEIYQQACELFEAMWNHVTPIRHLGIHTSRIRPQDQPRQLTLFDWEDSTHPDYEKLMLADQMTDELRGRFGIDCIKRAIFLEQVPIQHVAGGITRDKEHVNYSQELID